MFGKIAVLAGIFLAQSSTNYNCLPCSDFDLHRPSLTAPITEDQQAWADACPAWADWDQPGPAFKIFARTYYVGTCGISSILIETNQGLILIDGGTRQGAALIAANIESLGFDLTDVEILLTSHEHFDHVGGLAELQRRSGSALFASPAATQVMISGQASVDDPQYGMHEPFPKVAVFGKLGDGHRFDIGTIVLKAIATPGHTPGAMSYQWKSCEGDVCQTIVYADSLTPVSSDSYRFSDHPDYLAAFRESLDKVAALDCDILLTPHPSASGMRDKLLAGDLTGGMNCRAYAEAIGKRLDARLTQEAAGAQ